MSKSATKSNPFGSGLDCLKRPKPAESEETETSSKSEEDEKDRNSQPQDNQEEPPAKKSNFAFRKSKLGDVADKLWEHSKAEELSTKKDSTGHVASLLEAEIESGKDRKNAVSPNSKEMERKTSYVFGKNIENRVSTAAEKAENGAEEATESGFSDLAEKAVPRAAEQEEEAKSDSQSGPGTSNDQEGKSKLAESAKSFEEKTEKKPVIGGKTEEVEIMTGEEGEMNLIQAKCKLHVFDSESKSWHERGQGTIRINDRVSDDPDTSKETRLVMRVQGSLRVALNSKVWHEMLLERVGPKKLKISAMDSETKTVLLYLITSSQPDSENIEEMLKKKIDRLKQNEDAK